MRVCLWKIYIRKMDKPIRLIDLAGDGDDGHDPIVLWGEDGPIRDSEFRKICEQAKHQIEVYQREISSSTDLGGSNLPSPPA